MKDYYPRGYYENLASIDKKLYHWYQEGKLHKLRTQSKGGRLLEVGCNEGLFLHLARQAGWETQGVEIAELGAVYAREILNLEVFNGELIEANFPDEYFDVVTFWHVLEHLLDPQLDLREAHRILKLDGLLIVDVPNIASWQAKVFSSNWKALDIPRHLYHFSPDSLRAMLAQAGFTCFKMSHWSRGHNMSNWREWSMDMIFHLVPKSPSELQSPRAFGQGLPGYLRRALFLPLYASTSILEQTAVLLGRGGSLTAFARKKEYTETDTL